MMNVRMAILLQLNNHDKLPIQIIDEDISINVQHSCLFAGIVDTLSTWWCVPLHILLVVLAH